MSRSTILVVEDDPGGLLLLERALREMGYAVVVATGPQTALERITEFQPDGLIVDIHLPAMRGTDLLPLLHNSAGESIPALAITGDPYITMEEVQAKGFITLLRKPYRLQQLQETLAALLN